MRHQYTFCKALLILLIPVTVFSQQNTLFDSPGNTKEQPKLKKWKRADWIIPSSLILTGSLLVANKSVNENFLNNYDIREERNEHFKNFSTSVDDVLQYVPAASAFILSLTGTKGRNDLPNQLALFIKTEIVMTAIVVPTKMAVGEKRPDSGAHNSFPSGHTAQAFAAATFLAKEYGRKNIWYSIGGYTMATGVAACRVLNNRHWLSDVLAGAGIGMLSANLVYLTHQHKWGKQHKNTLTVSPTYGYGSKGLYLAYKF